MFSSNLFVAALALVPAAFAQTRPLGDVSSAIASARLQLSAVGLVPDPIAEDLLRLQAGLTLNFGQGDVAPGQSVGVDAVKQAPTYKLQYTEAQAANLTDATFTVMFLDAGAVGVGNADGLLTRHFLGNNFKLNSQGVLENTTAAITEYASPAPAAGSGPHRYFQVIFRQPASFQAPANLSTPGTPLSTMSLAGYAGESNLRRIVAASFVLIEDSSRPVTDSIRPTSAVPSASVAALATSVAASLDPAATGGASPSGSGTASAPTGSNTSSPSGAGFVKPVASVAGVVALFVVAAATLL